MKSARYGMRYETHPLLKGVFHTFIPRFSSQVEPNPPGSLRLALVAVKGWARVLGCVARGTLKLGDCAPLVGILVLAARRGGDAR